MVAGSPVVQAGLRALLEHDPDIELVENPASSELVVIDGELSSIDADGPLTILLSDDADAARQSDLWPSRIRAILPRDVTADELIAAVRAVAAGFVLLRPEEADRLVLPARAATASTGESLTPREMEVLQLIAEGESNKRIAWRLSISEHTVKFHVASILDKLQAGSRAEAVAIGVRRGLIYL